ncbi:CGNR zinc finger domain-containing protein [Amycolatopsis cihanbeyliensis]|uniref:CGNR zinc finger domain-containing protein n=1 Tax=Amycolatopsis cihanbeyliensis TaxID=1128664 RepID=UPI001153A8F4|nr:CGNR zinc finger domain-containing protein [Amycolatopsis cihanbeyliensis]
MSTQVAESSDVSLVLDFLNTVDAEHDTDVLRTAESWRVWTERRDLAAGSLPQAREARDALRAAVGDPALPPGPADATVRVELRADTPELVPSTAVGAVLAAATRLAVLGRWERVKICPADDCRWAFYDRSRNRSRTWCSMQTCGNREKARSWRERAAQAED